MGWFNALFGSDLIGKIINPESGCSAESESPPYKTHMALLCHCYSVGHCEHPRERFPVRLTQSMEHCDGTVLRHGQRAGFSSFGIH